LCFDTAGALVAKGKLGGEVSIEEGKLAARACALNVLSQVTAATGNLDQVVRVVRLGGFINAMPDFIQIAAVMNGASDLMGEVFEEKGRHAAQRLGLPVCRWTRRLR
jgi:enamine deaminase RidA (YjgF/YER057c/UK114 family)